MYFCDDKTKTVVLLNIYVETMIHFVFRGFFDENIYMVYLNNNKEMFVLCLQVSKMTYHNTIYADESCKSFNKNEIE